MIQEAAEREAARRQAAEPTATYGGKTFTANRIAAG